MGGKGSQPVQTNNQIVAMQQQQAQQATEANKQTQARLQQGVNEINQMFQGAPSGSTMLDLSSLANAQPYTGALPTTSTAPTSSGLSAQQMYDAINAYHASTGQWSANPPGTSSTGYGGQLAGGYSWGVLGDTGGGTSYGIWDPSGNLVTDANSLADLSKAQIAVGGDPNNLTGGFGNDFYNNYRNSILNYYLPQEDQQYQNARTSLNYGLARAGQLNSGTAGMDIANLAQQDTMNQAQIGSQADTQTATLRNQIAQDQQTALNQLYSTENPTVAANTAGNMVANANLTKPVLDPVGQLFSNISVGVGNAISGFTNPYAYINPTAGGIGSTMTQGTGQTSSPSSSSGVAGQG